MKRVIVVLLILGVLLAGCAQQEKPAATSTPTPTPEKTAEKKDELKLVKPGKLTVGSDVAYPPFEYTNQTTGEYEGFDIDLAKELAERLGLELEVINTAWDGIIPGLLAHKYDVIISAMTITEERAKQVSFSDPYFEAKQVILAKKGSGIKGVEDLAGKKVGVQLGTTGDFAAQKLIENGIKFELVKYEDTPSALMAIEKGDIDAAIIDNFVAYLAQKNNPDVFEVIEDKTFEPEYYGIAVNKDNPALLEAINKALKEMKEDGTYDKIYQKWFGE